MDSESEATSLTCAECDGELPNRPVAFCDVCAPRPVEEPFFTCDGCLSESAGPPHVFIHLCELCAELRHEAIEAAIRPHTLPMKGYAALAAAAPDELARRAVLIIRAHLRTEHFRKHGDCNCQVCVAIGVLYGYTLQQGETNGN